ncbi:hypothetical protein X798_06563, partial [Onchocerca flexuosa]
IANGFPGYLLTSLRNGTARNHQSKCYTTKNGGHTLTRANARIPVVKYNSITRTVRTKTIVSVVSDHTITLPFSYQLCQLMYLQKQMDGIPFIQSYNEVQYSYGWEGIKCQSTLISNLDNSHHCMVKLGNCITTVGIVLWNSTEIVNHCPDQKVEGFKIVQYGDHFILNELQIFLVIDNEDTIMTNCRFTNPYLMKGNIILHMDVENDKNSTEKSKRETTKQLLRMEISPEETFNPNNI